MLREREKVDTKGKNIKQMARIKTEQKAKTKTLYSWYGMRFTFRMKFGQLFSRAIF